MLIPNSFGRKKERRGRGAPSDFYKTDATKKCEGEREIWFTNLKELDVLKKKCLREAGEGSDSLT